MTSRITRLALGTALAAAMAAAPTAAFGTGTTAGSDTRETLGADLEELNGSDGVGAVQIVQDGDEISVTLRARGMSAMLPHAQHVHLGGANECPDISADQDADGLISTAEGQPAYGAVRLSLTTEGDTGPGSGLAVERFPAADEDGFSTYSRTFTLPEDLSGEDLVDGVIVVHGISEIFDDERAYDGEPRSSLDSSLPLEATVPALCGELQPVEEDEDEDLLLNIFGDGDDDNDDGLLENLL